MPPLEQKTVQRTDVFKSPFNRVQKTNKGFLRVKIRATRTGVLNYNDVYGNTVRELKHPNEVFRHDSMVTLNNSPVTIDHPNEFVNESNANKLSVGLTDSDVQIHDGKYLDISSTITDKEAIEKIEKRIKNGEDQEVSCGYTALVVKQDGNFDGEDYDYVQTDIKYNHISLVDSGRAGNSVKLILNSSNSLLSSAKENTINNEKLENSKGEKVMPREEIESQKEDQLQEIKDLKSNLRTYTDLNEDLKNKVEVLQAKNDTLTAENKKLTEKQDEFSPEKVHDLVLKRKEILDIAHSILDKSDHKSLEKLSEIEIKKEILKKELPSIVLDEKSDTYIEAAFDSIKVIKLQDKKTEDESVKALELKDSSVKKVKTDKDYFEESRNLWKVDLDKTRSLNRA